MRVRNLPRPVFDHCDQFFWAPDLRILRRIIVRAISGISAYSTADDTLAGSTDACSRNDESRNDESRTDENRNADACNKPFFLSIKKDPRLGAASGLMCPIREAGLGLHPRDGLSSLLLRVRSYVNNLPFRQLS